MRILVSIASLAFLAGTATAQQYSNEAGTYRYGGTYSKVQSSSASSCAALCAQERVCRAWSFQRATRGLGSATCELKAVVGKAVKNPLMTSGINPLIASQGQARAPQVAPVRQAGTLLGAPQQSPVRTVIRNNPVRSLPQAPRPLTPVQTFTPPPQPAPAPAPVIRRAPSPVFTPAPLPAAPTRTFTPPPPRAAPAPVISRAPAPVIAAPAPAPTITAAPVVPTRPAPVVTRQPAATRPLPPPPAPIIQAAPRSQAPDERIQVPVTQGQLPPGAVLRDGPLPTISFAPPGALPPLPAGSTVPSAAPVVTSPVARVQAPVPAPVIPARPAAPVAPAVRETITLPKSSKTQTKSKLLNTVPAGSVPPPPVDPNKPYQNLGSREFPEFSVNNNTVLTPDQYEAELAAEVEASTNAENDQLFETLDSVDLGGGDLANDLGQPLAPPNERRIPGSPGSVAAGGGS